MLKKTLLATLAVGATLLSLAAILPVLAQPGSGQDATGTTQASKIAQAATDSRTQDTRDRLDRNERDANERFRTDGAASSAYKHDQGDDHGEKRGDEHRRVAHAQDHDSSRD
jgi:hypothetical protein